MEIVVGLFFVALLLSRGGGGLVFVLMLLGLIYLAVGLPH